MKLEIEENKIQKDLNFADEEGNIYKTYLSLDEVMLNKPADCDFESLTLYIAKQAFKVSEYRDCFIENDENIILNLDRLLGLKDRLQSQVLTFVLKDEKKRQQRELSF